MLERRTEQPSASARDEVHVFTVEQRNALAEPQSLRVAMAASVAALMREGAEANLPHTDAVAQRLAELQ